MKIRKIIALTMPEAMNRVKKELGSDAVILYTKNIKKKSFFGMINKKAVEVVAAVDIDRAVASGNTAPINGFPTQYTPSYSVPVKPTVNPVNDKPPLSQEPKNSVEREWMTPNSSVIKVICEKLIGEGVGTEHVDSIGQALLKFWYSKDNKPSEKEVLIQLKKILLQKLPNDFSGIDYKNKILILLGPTGVGKTTTAAKLASKAVLDDGKSVAFITTDTYRIAAVDQLKTYAKILNVPVEVAYTMGDFIKAIKMHSDKDLIIVDSAGRNYQQSKFVNELKDLIPFGNGMETHLVLAATTKPKDLSHIANQFGEIPINKYIITKVDETNSLVSLLDLLLDQNIGISYFTNGQNVPDDLIEKEKEAFVSQLMEGVYNG